MSHTASNAQRLLLNTLGGMLVAFLLLPLGALLVTASPATMEQALNDRQVWPALRLSLLTTSISLVVVVVLGTPLAWALAHAQSRWARAIEICAQLPIVIPPAVAGVALVLAFGRQGLVPSIICPSGCSLAFTTSAVVMAEIFVSAPFFLQAALSAFRQVDSHLVLVARTFGASPLRIFFQVALPLAAPGILAGAAMSWARSLGEFGATLMFAGNLAGRTQTLPLAIYTALESDLRVAQAMSILLVVVAFALLLFVRTALRRASPEREQVS